MIEALTGFPDNVAPFVCRGQITHADYETVLIPDVKKRPARNDRVRVYYEIVRDFAGVDPAVVWDTRKSFSHTGFGGNGWQLSPMWITHCEDSIMEGSQQ